MPLYELTREEGDNAEEASSDEEEQAEERDIADDADEEEANCTDALVRRIAAGDDVPGLPAAQISRHCKSSSIPQSFSTTFPCKLRAAAIP